MQHAVQTHHCAPLLVTVMAFVKTFWRWAVGVPSSNLQIGDRAAIDVGYAGIDADQAAAIEHRRFPTGSACGR